MLKKLWQRLTGKAEAEEDDKQGDNRQEDDEPRDDTDNSAHFLRPDKTAGWFYVAVSGLLASVVTWESFRAVTLDSNGWRASGLKVVADVLSHSGQAMAAVILWSALIAEIGRLLVVLARFVKQDLDRKLEERAEKRLDKAAAKAAKKADKEAREEERAKLEAERAANDEWLKRRDEAQEKGEPFDEEPPWRDNGR